VANLAENEVLGTSEKALGKIPHSRRDEAECGYRVHVEPVGGSLVCTEVIASLRCVHSLQGRTQLGCNDIHLSRLARGIDPSGQFQDSPAIEERV
jgi:hypothetical protein